MPLRGKKAVPPEAIARFNKMIAERVEKGIATYGTTLMTFNGRDPIRDLMEELIDAWQYVVQVKMEQDTYAELLIAVFNMYQIAKAEYKGADELPPSLLLQLGIVLGICSKLEQL